MLTGGGDPFALSAWRLALGWRRRFRRGEHVIPDPACCCAEKSTPGGSATGAGGRRESGYSAGGAAPGTGQSDFTLGTPAAESTGAPTPNARTPQSLDLTKHLPRRVTMDPGQLFGAHGAAAAESPAGLAAAGGEEDSETDKPGTENFTFTSGLTSLEGGAPAGITTEVPRLSDLAADDEDAEANPAQTGSEPTDDFATAGEHTMMMLQGLKENQHGGAFGDVTAGVPSLTALADEDDLDASVALTTGGNDTRTMNVSVASGTSSDASPAVGGLPMGTVTEDVAAGLAADLAAQVARDQARHSGEGAAEDAVEDAVEGAVGGAVEGAVAADATVAMDLGFTAVLPMTAAPTPTATVQFGNGGAPTPTATVAFSQGAPTPTADSGFGFTRALEGGAHDAWGGKHAEGGAPSADVTVTLSGCASR